MLQGPQKHSGNPYGSKPPCPKVTSSLQCFDAWRSKDSKLILRISTSGFIPNTRGFRQGGTFKIISQFAKGVVIQISRRFMGV